MRTKHRIEVFEAHAIEIGYLADHGVEVSEERFKRWAWRIRHRNGNKLATSETYTRLSTARRIARNVAKAGGFEIVDLTKKRKA